MKLKIAFLEKERFPPHKERPMNLKRSCLLPKLVELW